MWIAEQRHILELSKTAEQRGLAKGEAKGRAEGKAEGKAEGETVGKANMLLRLLCRRFKTVPPDVERRGRAADIDHLDEWSDRFVDARELVDVFGTDQPH
ncbi:hypothetical protein WCLP8_840003 [uncultured Gammaproteobacteria bacterium]